MDAADFYTDLVADAYALLKGETFDADRYADFVREHGEPALEVGCGDGHPLLELRRRGLDVDGLDSSADMIAAARTRAQAERIDVDLHLARMEEMDLPRRGQYLSIYLAGPTFNLLPDDETAQAALTAFAEHLHPEGTAMVPLWIPEPTAEDQLGTTREAVADDGSRLRYTPLAEEIDEQTRTRHTAVRYERVDPGAGQPVEIVEREWVIHWQTQDSLRELCDTAGLRIDRHDHQIGAPDRPGHQTTVYLARA